VAAVPWVLLDQVDQDPAEAVGSSFAALDVVEGHPVEYPVGDVDRKPPPVEVAALQIPDRRLGVLGPQPDPHITANEVEPMLEDDGRYATDWLQGLPS
jgi:hypothetical protein